MKTLWIIERRDAQGKLSFDLPQPSHYFGACAVTGMTEDFMARVIFAAMGDVVLVGDKHVRITLSGPDIEKWPSLIHPEFVARKKTW